MKLPRSVVRVANAITNFAIIAGITRPPYTRQNALVIETVGRKSGRGHRIPVGYLADADRILVVVEDGLQSNWVRNALAQNGRYVFTSEANGAPRSCVCSTRIPSTIWPA